MKISPMTTRRRARLDEAIRWINAMRPHAILRSFAIGHAVCEVEFEHEGVAHCRLRAEGTRRIVSDVRWHVVSLVCLERDARGDVHLLDRDGRFELTARVVFVTGPAGETAAEDDDPELQP